MRTKLADRQLPNYTRGEEIFNMVSHTVGFALGIVVLVLCLITAANHNDVYGVVASAVYGSSMMLLYTMSSIYHGLTHITAKKVFQVLDHCSIYLLIAGTYTPIALCSLREYNTALGWTVFGVEWGLAILAITLTAIDIKKFQVFSMICNIVMGWGIAFIWNQAVAALTFNGFALLLLGGIFYTVGAILYGIGKRKKYMHNVFHVFVILGSLAQFFAIILYVL